MLATVLLPSCPPASVHSCPPFICLGVVQPGVFVFPEQPKLSVSCSLHTEYALGEKTKQKKTKTERTISFFDQKLSPTWAGLIDLSPRTVSKKSNIFTIYNSQANEAKVSGLKERKCAEREAGASLYSCLCREQRKLTLAWSFPQTARTSRSTCCLFSRWRVRASPRTWSPSIFSTKEIRVIW